MKYLLRLQLRHFCASGFDRCFLILSLYVPEVVFAVKHFTELAGLCNNLDGNLVNVRAQYLHGSGGKEWNNRRFIFPYRGYGSIDFKTFNFHEVFTMFTTSTFLSVKTNHPPSLYASMISSEQRLTTNCHMWDHMIIESAHLLHDVINIIVFCLVVKTSSIRFQGKCGASKLSAVLKRIIPLTELEKAVSVAQSTCLLFWTTITAKLCLLRNTSTVIFDLSR